LLSIVDLEERGIIGVHSVVLRRDHDPALAIQAALEGAVVEGKELVLTFGHGDEGEGCGVQRDVQGFQPGLRNRLESIRCAVTNFLPAGPELGEQVQEQKEPDGVGAHE
jgi:hypothetical protein